MFYLILGIIIILLLTLKEPFVSFIPPDRLARTHYKNSDIINLNAVCPSYDGWGYLYKIDGKYECISHSGNPQPKPPKPPKPHTPPSIPSKPLPIDPSQIIIDYNLKPGLLHDYTTKIAPNTTNFNNLCRQTFGQQFGVLKKIATAPSFSQAVCSRTYNNGVTSLPYNNTYCLPFSDSPSEIRKMNNVCKDLFEQTLTGIDFTLCPQPGYARGICE